MIDRLQDELSQDSRQGLITLKFRIIRELIEATQALKARIIER